MASLPGEGGLATDVSPEAGSRRPAVVESRVAATMSPEVESHHSAVVEVDVVPVGPYRMPGGGMDGVLRNRDGVLERLLHVGGEPATVRAWVAGGTVRFRGEAASAEAAEDSSRMPRPSDF